MNHEASNNHNFSMKSFLISDFPAQGLSYNYIAPHLRSNSYVKESADNYMVSKIQRNIFYFNNDVGVGMSKLFFF